MCLMVSDDFNPLPVLAPSSLHIKSETAFFLFSGEEELSVRWNEYTILAAPAHKRRKKKKERKKYIYKYGI